LNQEPPDRLCSSAVEDGRHNIPDLLKNGRAHVADLCAHAWRRDGADVLALRGGVSSQAVAIIGFDGDLAAAFASRAGKGNYVNNVRSATENSLGGEDDSRPSQTRLGAGRRAEIELDDVTRRQHRAKRVRPHA